MELDEAKQILNDNGYLLEKQVQKNIVLYHGCRNGNLKIDYNRENEIWLTPDIQMAVDYACKREINRYGDHSIVTTLNKNSKSCVYKIKLNSDVNLIDFTNEKDRKLFLAKALELRGIDDMSEKDKKEHLEDLKTDYLRFVKGLVDSADLPLNISREMLQEDRAIKKIASNVEKKILSELSRVLKNEREKY